MKRSKVRSCQKSRCSETAEIMGFCRQHYEEYAEDAKLRDEAVQALHRGTLDNDLFKKIELSDEFSRLQKWWFRTCDSLNYSRKDPILGDEAEYSKEWCISLAKVIIREERAYRGGDLNKQEWDSTRDWVWERFRNLEAGLMSNGISRSSK